MKMGVWLLVAVVLVGGAWQWHKSDVLTAADLRNGPDASVYGFVPLPNFDGENTNLVYVLAAENCPHAVAQRADKLARALADLDVPVKRIHSVGFSMRPDWAPPGGKQFSSREEAERWMNAHAEAEERWEARMKEKTARIDAILGDRWPVVFVRGKAVNDPALDEVLGEYRAGTF